MPSRRMIDPRFWESENVSSLTYRQRLLFIGLFSNADDQGRIKGHPALIRATVFPFDDISLEEIETDLKAVEAVGSIKIYQDGGKTLIQILNWWDYQSPQWAYPSDLPPMDGWSDQLRYRQNNKVITDNWRGESLPHHLRNGQSPPDGGPDGLGEGGGVAEGEGYDYTQLPKDLGKDQGKRIPKAIGSPIELGLELGNSNSNNSSNESLLPESNLNHPHARATADQAAASAKQMTIDLGQIYNLSQNLAETICQSLVEEFAMGRHPPETIKQAYQKALGNQKIKRPGQYARAILNDWAETGPPESEATSNGIGNGQHQNGSTPGGYPEGRLFPGQLAALERWREQQRQKGGGGPLVS